MSMRPWNEGTLPHRFFEGQGNTIVTARKFAGPTHHSVTQLVNERSADFDEGKLRRYNTPPHVPPSARSCPVTQRVVGRAGELASGDGWRCLSCQREALALIRSNGPVHDRTTIDAFPSIENEEEVREPLHHHQPITLGTFHVVLLLGTIRSR